MIAKYRKQYNQAFSFEKYEKLKQTLAERAGTPVGFRLSESPIFMSNDFKIKLESAAQDIIEQIKRMPHEELIKAVPKKLMVPNDTKQPHFLAIDFGICKDSHGEIVPQLIELQAFPALFAFQEEFEEAISEMYPFLKDLRNSLPKPQYIQLLKDVIVGDENPKNVILLEIFPEKQKTEADFRLTEKYLGIKTVCLTKIIKRGRQLYYDSNGQAIPIRRIYNRVIFDELAHLPNLQTEFKFTDEVDVQWVTHPNWFFKVSKYILPKLSHPYVPKSYFVKDFPNTEKLEDYVLKPLFSFAGSGVNLKPTPEDIRSLEGANDYILQRKVYYEPLFEDINGEKSKAEIRLLYLWKENEEYPELMDNLVRLTKVAMANVDFNKQGAIWIGSTLAFFEKKEDNLT